MPIRVLSHGEASRSSGVRLTPGSVRDVPVSDQFLLDLEFLGRYTETGVSCLYTTRPAYLGTIAKHFPWLHFYAYGCDMGSEYDPGEPCMQGCGPLSVEVRGNITYCTEPFTRELALSIGRRDRQCNPMVMVCHGETPDRQLVFHALMAPSYSLLELSSPPPEYAQGEIVLPIGIPRDRSLIFLVVPYPARSREYDRDVFREEMGHFQSVLRSTETYDDDCRTDIINEYAEFHQHSLNCPGVLLVMGLRVDLQQLEGV